MSILDSNKIDIVGTRPDSAIVRLVIADHLEWGDLETHARLVQDKVNTYLEFIESGQMTRMVEPPIPPNPEVHIVLVLQHIPTAEARAFLMQVEEFLTGAGVTFDVEVPGDRSPRSGAR